MRASFPAALVVVAAVGCWGCASDAEVAERPKDVVVLDKLEWLKDGEQYAFKLDPGTYKVDMTASGDGASFEWVGSSCPGSGQTKSFSSMCELTSTGQLLIKNPTTLGLGDPVSVTVKVIRLGR